MVNAALGSGGALCGFTVGSQYIQMYYSSGFNPFFGPSTPSNIITGVDIRGAWHHLALTLGPSFTYTAYIDGVAYSVTGSGSPSGTANFYIGEDGGGDFLNGACADVAVWNITLSPTQISSLASGERANTIGANANLGGYWPILGQSPEPDKSGNGYNGTLTGTTVVAGPPSLQPF